MAQINWINLARFLYTVTLTHPGPNAGMGAPVFQGLGTKSTVYGIYTICITSHLGHLFIQLLSSELANFKAYHLIIKVGGYSMLLQYNINIANH